MEKSLQTLNSDNKIQLWSERIRECRASGQNIRTWCRENNLSHHAYYYWQKRIFEKLSSQGSCFAEVPLAHFNGAAPIARLSVNGIEMELYSGVNSCQVAELVNGLKQC